MNKHFFKYNYWSLAAFILIVACTPNTVDVYQGPDVVHFMTTENSLIVGEDNPEIEISIGTTVASERDRIYNLSILEEGTTAIEGVGFEFIDQSAVIPAGEVLGTFNIRGLFDGALVEGTRLNLTLSNPNEGSLAEFDNIFTLDFYKFCQFDQNAFVGDYTTYDHSYWGEFVYPVTTVPANMFSIHVLGLWDVQGAITEITFNRDSTNCYILDQPFFNNASYGEVYIKSYEDGVFNSCTGNIEGLACYIYEKNKGIFYDIVTFDLVKNGQVSSDSENYQMRRLPLSEQSPKFIDGR